MAYYKLTIHPQHPTGHFKIECFDLKKDKDVIFMGNISEDIKNNQWVIVNEIDKNEYDNFIAKERQKENSDGLDDEAPEEVKRIAVLKGLDVEKLHTKYNMIQAIRKKRKEEEKEKALKEANELKQKIKEEKRKAKEKKKYQEKKKWLE